MHDVVIGICEPMYMYEWMNEWMNEWMYVFMYALNKQKTGVDIRNQHIFTPLFCLKFALQRQRNTKATRYWTFQIWHKSTRLRINDPAMQFTSLFPIGQLACQIVYVVMQYFLTASFCWMLVEGINIYNKIVLVFNRGSCNKKLFYLVGWGKWWQWENYKVVWIRIISHNYANFCEIFCKFSAKLFCERAAVTEADPCHRIGPLGLFQISHKQPKERGYSKIF